MIRKLALGVASVVVVLAAVVGVLYVTNGTPEVPVVPAAEAANPGRPYVVKLHAQWCPICRFTKSVWEDLEAEYGDRVNLVVFDFTDEATTEASFREAERLGLTRFFDENAGWTGTISVIDGRTKDVVASIHASRDMDEYRVAIDAALAAMAP